MNKKIKKIVFIVCSFLLAFFIIANVGSLITYSILFKRAKDIDYSITPGLINYELVKDVLPRKEYRYTSNDETLCGYFYKNNDKSPLIVVSSGYNDVSDSLLFYHKYFYDLGYNVFSYDNCGSGKSTGTQKGFFQSLIDLESTLKFINNTSDFKNLPLFLFGYSAGGYATTAIFNINDFNVLACVSIAGYNDASALMIEKGKQYVGFLSFLGKPAIDAITYYRFKDYLSYTAIGGIIKTNIPFYIFHGQEDKVIPINQNSIYCKQTDLINKNVYFESYETQGHISILYDSSVLKYQEEVNDTLKSLKSYKEKQDYIGSIDPYYYSKTNLTMTNKVHQLYQSVIKF